jgi:hypothetical protein
VQISELLGPEWGDERTRKAAPKGGFILLPKGSGHHGVTVKTPLLETDPPAVVIAMCPVFAPVGTVAVTSVAELSKKLAFTPPKVTFVACRLTPVIVTDVPARFARMRRPRS